MFTAGWYKSEPCRVRATLAGAWSKTLLKPQLAEYSLRQVFFPGCWTHCGPGLGTGASFSTAPEKCVGTCWERHSYRDLGITVLFLAMVPREATRR